MTQDEYRKALEAAAREYEALGAERQRIDKRLSELAQTIATLSRLVGLVPTLRWGLTDACRTVVRNAGVPMTPIDVRDRLRGIGFDLSRYANDIAAVHTTLKRLNDAQELRMVGAPGVDKAAYVWNRPPKAAMLGPDATQVMRELAERKATTPSAKRKVKR